MKLYEETGGTYVNKKGKTVKRTTKTTRMADVDDAYKLSSGSKMENLYADHANGLKSLANRARKAALGTSDIPYSPSAAKTFEPEAKSLSAKLSVAIRNKPLERKAQIMAAKIVKAKKEANPDMDKATLKKLKAQALEESRTRYGAKKQDIQITDREWQAIQAGAVSPTKLKSILSNTDTAKVKERALPRTNTVMTPTKMTRARAMMATGYTPSEIADALGVAVSTVTSAMEAEG